MNTQIKSLQSDKFLETSNLRSGALDAFKWRS